MIMKQLKIPVIDVKKYGGKQVAIVNGKIVAVGISTSEVLKLAKQRIAKKNHDKIWLLVVPKSLTLVYYL